LIWLHLICGGFYIYIVETICYCIIIKVLYEFLLVESCDQFLFLPHSDVICASITEQTMAKCNILVDFIMVGFYNVN
jgi:hypothetical protein